MDTPTQRDWEQEYERMLSEGLQAGRVSKLPSASEKRRHPRFKVDGGKIYVTEQVPHPIIDLSISGLAFYSEKTFPVGQAIQVSLRSVISIEAVVLGCEPLTGDDAPAPYRVRCQFADADYGLRFLMLALELESGFAQAEAPGGAAGRR